jgi:hypothetical protein
MDFSFVMISSTDPDMAGDAATRELLTRVIAGAMKPAHRWHEVSGEPVQRSRTSSEAAGQANHPALLRRAAERAGARAAAGTAGWHVPGSAMQAAEDGWVRVDVAGRTRGCNEHAGGKHHGFG